MNMSGDEQDGPEKQYPPIWRIMIARWQSQELRNFFWALDRMYREDWRKEVNGGNMPRQRVFCGPKESTVEDGVAPIGLWRNCYDPVWLSEQPPHIIRELEIVDEDYDFSL